MRHVNATHIEYAPVSSLETSAQHVIYAKLVGCKQLNDLKEASFLHEQLVTNAASEYAFLLRIDARACDSNGS